MMTGSRNPQAERERLRIGQGPWVVPRQDVPWKRVGDLRRAEVVIVGGGITGALIAENLTARGRQVVVIDRLTPGLDSTAASTAMLQWEIDRSVVELEALKGLEDAAWAYRASFAAVQGLAALISRHRISCHFAWREALYLAADDENEQPVAHEHRLRRRIGLPGVFLDAAALKARFGIARPAAILSPGAAEVDPLCLARSLLLKAVADGAHLVHGDVQAYDVTKRGAAVQLSDGEVIEGGALVLATGYALPDFLDAPAHRRSASWAAVTPPMTELGFWPGRALVWEDATPYLYARTTADGRILVGGEDEAVGSTETRDALSPFKAATLHSKIERIWNRSLPPFSSVWSAAFGETTDGLPLIGALPGAPHVQLAYGYGGNGITFSYLASRLIASALSGRSGDWVEHFAPDRPAG